MYRLSFTAASLAHSESMKVYEIYTGENSWSEAEKVARNKGILGLNNTSTGKRKIQEIKLRLRCLSAEQLELLGNTDPQTERQLLYLAICKSYQFIADFVIEVLRNKYLIFDLTLYESDFVNYYQQKQELYPKLATITDTTRNKIKQVLYRTLREAGVIEINPEIQILQQFLDNNLIKVIRKDDPQWLKCFFFADSEI